MKAFTIAALCFLLLAGLALAAPIDGKWVSTRTMERNGQSFTFTSTFDLKSEGSTLTGTVATAFGDREPRSVPIKDGKVDGNKFSFTTMSPGRDGNEIKVVYDGTVEGDTLKGTAAREGGDPRPFEAKKK
jgi:hypothetical protein